MSLTPEQVDAIADRLAITDVVNRYFDLVDAKRWDDMDQVFTEDATAQETADRVLQGRAQTRRQLPQLRGQRRNRPVRPPRKLHSCRSWRHGRG